MSRSTKSGTAAAEKNNNSAFTEKTINMCKKMIV